MFKGNVNFAVGLFLSVALTGLAGFAMWLAGSKGNEPMQNYSVLFEDDISGLAVGGPVFYLGVNVGEVTDTELVPGKQIKVRVDMKVLKSTPIDSGSTASLMGQGITGVTVINISGTPGEQAPLRLTEGFKYPLIPVKQTGLSALLANMPQTISKLNHLLDQANLLLGDENRESITAMLHHLDSLTGDLANEGDTIAELPGELKTLLQDARTTLATVHDLVVSVQPDVEGTMSHLNEASANLTTLSDRVDTLLAKNEAELDHFVHNGLGQVPELIMDLRTTLRDLQKLLQQLQENPSQLIFKSPDDAVEVKP
jgi:phospholipid/cholesterol/gamma-HCH transport system substrate-binding protein